MQKLYPDQWFDLQAVRSRFRLDEKVLELARQAGTLRCVRRAGQLVFLGKWFNDWAIASGFAERWERIH
jgi:hypothetical protein